MVIWRQTRVFHKRERHRSYKIALTLKTLRLCGIRLESNSSTWCKNFFFFFLKMNMLRCYYWRIRPSEGPFSLDSHQIRFCSLNRQGCVAIVQQGEEICKVNASKCTWICKLCRLLCCVGVRSLTNVIGRRSRSLRKSSPTMTTVPQLDRRGGFIKTEGKTLPFHRSVGFGVNAAVTLTWTNHFSQVSDVLLLLRNKQTYV